MAACRAKAKSGARCKMPALKESEFCFTHSTDTRAQQAHARKAGGIARHTPHYADPAGLPENVTTIDDERKILDYALAEVVGMDNTIARARVLIALAEAFGKLREIGELEARIAALEAKIK